MGVGNAGRSKYSRCVVGERMIDMSKGRRDRQVGLVTRVRNEFGLPHFRPEPVKTGLYWQLQSRPGERLNWSRFLNHPPTSTPHYYYYYFTMCRITKKVESSDSHF